MSLQREWWGTNNYTYGDIQDKQLIVVHTTEGWYSSPNGMYDCADYFDGNVGASSNVVTDNYHTNHIIEMVTRANGAWTQCNENWRSVSNEQCATAAWSRDTWLTKNVMLRNTAGWIAEESEALQIPIRLLSNSEAQSGNYSGVCGHSFLGSYGCGHGDPGGNYPWDIVLQWAIEIVGGGTPQPEPEPEREEDMTYFRIPPRSVSALREEISLDGAFSTVGICTDASTNEHSTELRVACHIGQGNWATSPLYSDPGKEKQVLAPGKFDGLRVDRVDSNETYITINVGR